MLAQAACVIDWAGYEAGGGGASAGGGSNTGGSASSDDCGRIGLLHDDFGDQAASAWYSIPGDTLGWATVVDGRVQVVSSSDYGALVSNWGWDLREGYVSVEVPTVPLVGNTSLVLTQGRQTSGKDLTILVSNGEIFAQSNGQQIGPSVAYSPAAHRFWRIGESGGTVYFKTSPDGEVWNELASQSVSELFPVEIVYVTLERTEGADEIAEFDNIEGGPATTKGWCGPRRFADDFHDGELANYWGKELEGGTFVEENGTALATALTGAARAGIESAQPIDLRGGAVSAELVDTVILDDMALVFLRAGTPDLNVKFLISESELAAVFDNGGNMNQCAVPLASLPDRWLQIREDTGTIYWETSTDGVSWKEFCKKAVPSFWDPSQVTLAIGVVNFGGAGGSVEFDNVNQP